MYLNGPPIRTDAEMRVPNAENAVIDPRKLYEYLLDPNHPDGASKADYLALAGYTGRDWAQLDSDLRGQLLSLEARPGRPSPYGRKYEVAGSLTGPNGVSLGIRSIWIVRHGESPPS